MYDELWGFPVAQCETWVQSLGWEDPLEEDMATHSSLAGYSPWGRKESDTTERLSKAHSTSWAACLINSGNKASTCSNRYRTVHLCLKILKK